jgi:molecular chaperone GrpE (heat shock protein)
MLASSNKFTATATTVVEFLPALDQLEELRKKYGDDSFGKQYSAVTGAIKTAFATLGVTDYTIQVGDSINGSRMNVVESKYSTEYPQNTVIEVLSPGMELNGNIVRAAQCIASLGIEPNEEESKVEDSTDADEEQFSAETEAS